MGYSMGANIAMELMLSHRGALPRDRPWRDSIRRWPRRPTDRDAISEAYRAEDPATIKSPVAKAYRRFAEWMPNDLRALASLIDAQRSPFDPARLAAVRMPVLIVVGSNDNAIGDPEATGKDDPGSPTGNARRPRPHDGADRPEVQGSRARISRRRAAVAARGCEKFVQPSAHSFSTAQKVCSK